MLRQRPLSSQRPIDRVLVWAVDKPQWGARLKDILLEITEPVCEDREIEIDELPEVLGADMHNTLFEAAIECFLTEYDDDGENVVDTYLKKRGYKEAPKAREYLTALRDSEPSLYEVSDIVRGEGFAVRDLVRGGEPVRIKEHLGSLEMRPWTHIYTRILTVRGTATMSGAGLVFTPELSNELLARFEDVRQKAPEFMKALNAAAGVELEDKPGDTVDAGDILISSMVVEVVQMWLDDVLYSILDKPPPELRNTEGDPIEINRLQYRLRDTARHEEIRAVLDHLPNVLADGDDTWIWVTAVENGVAAEDSSILGDISLEERVLRLTVNSATRASRARELFDPALAGLTGKPLVEQLSPEQLLAEAQDINFAKEAVGTPSPEEQKHVVTEFLDRHFHKLLDEPIPVLDGLTPREAVKIEASCDKTVNWLKQAENANAALGSPGLNIDYDLTWMWKELGILARRR